MSLFYLSLFFSDSVHGMKSISGTHLTAYMLFPYFPQPLSVSLSLLFGLFSSHPVLRVTCTCWQRRHPCEKYKKKNNSKCLQQSSSWHHWTVATLCLPDTVNCCLSFVGARVCLDWILSCHSSGKTNGAAMYLYAFYCLKKIYTFIPTPATSTPNTTQNTPAPSALVLLCSGTRQGVGGGCHYYTVHARCLLQLYFIMGTFLAAGLSRNSYKHTKQTQFTACFNISTSSLHSPTASVSLLWPPFILPLTYFSTLPI